MKWDFFKWNKYKIHHSKLCCFLLLHLFLIDFHLSFVDGGGFGEGFLEDSNKGIQMLFSMLRHDADSEPGLSNFHNWILDSINMNTWN